MNSAKEILKILKENKIQKISDVDKYQSSFENQAWTKDIFAIVKNDMEISQQELKDSDRKYFTFGDDSEETIKYTCMFPNTSINLKNQFEEQQTEKGTVFYSISNQYLKSLIKHKDLIKAGVYKLLPELIKFTGDSHCDLAEEYSTWSLAGKKNYRYGSLINKDVDIIDTNGIFLSDEKIEKLYFKFPWLYGVKIEDYIEIVNKNRLLYDNYSKTIVKFMDDLYKGDYTSVKKEMDDANISIKIELQKAQHNLYRKGIQTALSVAFTFVPMALSLPNEQKMIISAAMGATSLKEIIWTFSDEISNIRSVGKNSPFWLMYQWQKKVKI